LSMNKRINFTFLMIIACLLVIRSLVVKTADLISRYRIAK
jgi:hypothetical protein